MTDPHEPTDAPGPPRPSPARSSTSAADPGPTAPPDAPGPPEITGPLEDTGPPEESDTPDIAGSTSTSPAPDAAGGNDVPGPTEDTGPMAIVDPAGVSVPPQVTAAITVVGPVRAAAAVRATPDPTPPHRRAATTGPMRVVSQQADLGPSTTSVISTRNLTKRYGSVTAVRDLTLDVPAGIRFGLLGPNGSGKTTLVRMLLGLVHATSGSIEVLGSAMPRHAADVLPRVGALVENPAAWPHLSGRTNLRLLDAAGRGGRRGRRTRVEDALEQVGLAGVDRRPVRAYSLGMRQRLGLAAALMRRPELLLLDEPTNGLDPRGIGEMRTLLLALNAAGTTVVLSSHLLSEVEALCTRVGVLDRGRLVLADDLDALRAPTGRVRVRTPDPAAVVGLLDGQVVGRDGDTLLVRADDPGTLNARLVAGGIVVTELVAQRRTLEEIVLERTGASADRMDVP